MLTITRKTARMVRPRPERSGRGILIKSGMTAAPIVAALMNLSEQAIEVIPP